MLRPTSLLRQQGMELCEKAGFRPTVALEGDESWSVNDCDPS